MSLQINDSRIEKALKDGDEATFEQAFRQYYGRLCTYVAGFTNDIDEAEEVVQQVFVDIWEKRKELSVSVSFKSYLYRAAHNRAINRIRHGKVRQLHADEYRHVTSLSHENTAEAIHQKELQKKIAEAINVLPEQCRMVFKLSRFEDLKYSEIADQLGISVKTVENHMGKALRILREELKEYLPLIAAMLPWLFIQM
jgi:RNA polymerase sigma-70 factor (ECF subfamily)